MEKGDSMITKEEAEKELNELVEKSKPKVEVKEEKPKETVLSKDVDELEEKAKKDEYILSKDEAELSEEEGNRKKELLSNTKDDKVSKRKAEIQSDIDGLIAKKKALEEEVNQTEVIKSEMKSLRDEIESLKQEKARIDAEKSIPEEQKILRDKESDRLKKYLEEDASKPRADRREMTREELDDWYLESPVEVQEWMSERSLRRARERAKDEVDFKSKKSTDELSKKMAESDARVLEKHPELNTFARVEELKKQGKSERDIHNILRSENEKFRIASDIVASNPEKYLTNPNGPELVMAEMEKRLGAKETSSEEKNKIDELTSQIEELSAEIARLKGEDVGINSTVPKKISSNVHSDEEKKIISLMKELKAPQDKIDAAVNTYRKRKKEKGT